MGIFILLVTVTAGAIWCTGDAQRFTPEQQTSLDAYIKNVLKCRQIPALAISVVRGGETILARAYGKADVENGVDANEETLFCIGSLSKAFTSTLLAGLLAENSERYDWDTPVGTIIGDDFRFNDDMRTQHINIRDLLAHKTGIPMYFQALLTGLPEHVTLRDLVRRIRFLEPTKKIRTTFLYNNYMYGLAGHVASRIQGGTSWETLVRERIFEPLNMTSSGFIDQTPNPENFAFPYVTVNGSFVRVDTELATGVHPVGAAGSIISNTVDMAKWMKFHLRQGLGPSGRRLVDKKYLMDTHTGEMPQPFRSSDLNKPKYPIEDVRLSYSMGWLNSVYRGFRRMYHTGGISTYSSQLWLFNDLDMGIYVNVNGPVNHNSGFGVRAVLWYVADLLLGEMPWLNQTTACSFPEPWSPKAQHRQKKDHSRNMNYTLGLNYSTYVGTYHHPAFGNITVYLNTSTDSLNMKQGRFGHATLEPETDEDFEGEWIGPLWYMSRSDGMNAKVKVTFKISKPEAGLADELRINIDQSVLTSFRRKYNPHKQSVNSVGLRPYDKDVISIFFMLLVCIICNTGV